MKFIREHNPVATYDVTIRDSTVHGKILVREKISQFGELWASWLPKFSSPIFTDTPKMYLVYALTVHVA